MKPHQRAHGSRIATVAGLALLVAACQSSDQRTQVVDDEVPPPLAIDGTAYEAAARVGLPETPPREELGLHNVYALSDDIVSGSEPHGEEAFRVLKAMGIRTVLSVDGKVPDEELAARYGMKYVHVPIQYRGITDDELARIAKTFREQDEPFYVHCFHGKHRGPAAAEVGRLVLDGISREQAIAEMRQWCGTSPSYEGLYRTIAEGHIPSRAETSRYDWDFPAAHPFDGFRQAMIEVSRADDNLKYLSKRDWVPGADHPDVDAVNEAEKLASALARSAENEEVASRPSDFQGWMQDAVEASSELARALRSSQASSSDAAVMAKEAGEAYARLAQSCKACHEAYRND